MSEITSVSVSENAKSFAVTLKHSFQVYSIKPVKRIFMKDFLNYSISNISTINDGSIIAFSVKSLSTDAQVSKVFIWNNQYAEGICQLSFNEDVLSLFLSDQFLLIVLFQSVVIYDIENKTTQLEQVTYENKRGAADLISSNSNNERPLLAICGLQMGSVHLSEVMGESTPVIFQAHQHPISFIKFSPDGSLIATASEKGTIIRLFDTVTGKTLSTFRRGAIPSNILSMCFSPNNTQLIAISDNGTAHLFPADTRNGNPADPPRSIAKLSIEKGIYVRCVFENDNLLYIISSSGHLHKVKCSSRSLSLDNKFFVLAH